MSAPACPHCGCTCRSPARWHEVRVQLLLLANDMARALGELHLVPPSRVDPGSVGSLRGTLNTIRDLIREARTLADRLPPKAGR